MKRTERLSNAYEMAFEVALDKRHEFVTPEHLLYGIAHQDELEAIFTSYQVDPILFRVDLLDYLDQHIDTVPEEVGNYELLASAQLIQVIAISEQMAASSGHDEVDIPHALNAIMHLEDSQALYAIVHSFTDDPGEFLNCVVMAMNGETLPLHASPQEDSYDDYDSGSYNGGGLYWPVPGYAHLTTYFGEADAIYGLPHRGIDVAAPGGTPIVAAESGTVITAGWNGSYGNYIAISHGAGVVTLYAHCSALYVSYGDYVSAGQTIAAVGTTGDSTGNHLHFEVQVNGGLANPLSYTSP